ncbi:MAG: glycosyltransferase family 4 protein [Leptospiraceae bacterium]|nr:glycosyltransferase family 4 protein [Leptospiraceae bacterium]
MRILQTPVRFYPFIGGVENHVYYLSRELIKFGHDVIVICANEPKTKIDDEIDGIRIRRLPYITKISNTNITPKLPFELLKTEFDILHTHIPTPWSSDWSAIVSKIKKKPFILTYHNDVTGFGFYKYVSRIYNLTFLKALVNLAKKIIVTQYEYINRSTFLKKYANSHKIRVIPNGVDTQKFKPMRVERRHNTLFFLSVLDKFHRYKGLDYLIESLKLVKKEIKDLKLLVGGSGELLNYYKDLVRSLGLHKTVEFLGYIPEEKLVEYYNTCKVFVLPSTSSEQEGFGMVLLEALSCGTPVICTEISGIARDLRKYLAGIVVPQRDSKALAEAIIKMLKDDDLAIKMGKNGRKMIEEKYTWERVAKLTERVYEEVLR